MMRVSPIAYGLSTLSEMDILKMLAELRAEREPVLAHVHVVALTTITPIDEMEMRNSALACIGSRMLRADFSVEPLRCHG
jgi:hypothetical protein